MHIVTPAGTENAGSLLAPSFYALEKWTRFLRINNGK